MDEHRTPVTGRLDGFAAALSGLSRAMDLRLVQSRARDVWWQEDHPAPGPARSVRERHAALKPRRTSIENGGPKGRVLRTTEAVEAGAVLLAEPALVRSDPREDPDDRTPPFPWWPVLAVVRLDQADAAVIDDLHNAHVRQTDTYIYMARDLRLRGVDLPVDPARAGRLLGIVRTNAFGRPPGRPSSIYPAGAMAAHACEPSADRFIADGTTLFLQARRDLDAGEEVTISYLDSTRGAAERLPVLLTRYGFLCDCPRCVAAIRRDRIEPAEVRSVAQDMEDRFLAVAGGEEIS